MKTVYLAVICCLTSFSLFAMPSRSALQKVQGAVAELMADDMAAMKKGKIAPEKVAESALGYARESTDEASKFLFLKGAFGLFVQGRKYAESAQSESKPAAKKPAPALAVRGKYDWTIPNKLAKPKRVDFDFGGGVEKLSFFAVPAGRPTHAQFVAGSKMNVEVKMTHPFWMAQWPVTVPQYKLFNKADCRWGTEELHEKLAKDDDLRVFAITTMTGLEEYIAWLNATYGKLLPKGWVFRQPTMAEARLSWKMLGDARYDRDESKLKPLQKHGLYTEFSSVQEISERALKERERNPFFHGILSGARQGNTEAQRHGERGGIRVRGDLPAHS